MATTNAKNNSSSLISSVYTSRKILLELMSKQGYNTEEYDNFSVYEVNTKFQNKQLDMLLEKKKEDEDEKKEGFVPKKIYIRYYLAKTIRPQNLNEIIDDLFIMEEILTKEDILMVVVKDDANDTLIQLLKHIWEQDGIFIIIQSIKRLQFNILNHTLVPNHRVVKFGEKLAIKEKYNITNDEKFPEISRFDPVAQVIGIRPGEVCEIIRPSKTSIVSKYYRICV